MSGSTSTGRVRVAAAAGLSLAALTLAADRAGWLRPLERQSIDWRFVHAPRRDEPLSPEIRFVDIDDSALDFGGRWPWPRAKLALALAELVRARPRTLVLDLLLSEPEEGAPLAEGDARVAETLLATRAVIAVDCGDDDARALPGGGDAAARDALLDAIAQRWNDSPALVASATRAPQELARDVRVRPQTWRRMAAARALARLAATAGTPVALEAFTAALRGGATQVEDLHDAALLADVHRQYLAWLALRRFPLSGEAGEKGDPGERAALPLARAPLPEFASRAAAAGFVNFTPDPDGRLREIAVTRVVTDGRALQLGLAAALAHRGLPTTAVHVDDAAFTIGKETWPLIDEDSGSDRRRGGGGRLLLAWPTRGAAAEDDTPAWLDPASRCSLGRALDVGLARSALERVVAERVTLAARLAEEAAITGDAAALLVKVRDEAKFRCHDADEAEKQGALSAEETAAVAPYRQFTLVDAVATSGAAQLEAAEAQLAKLLADKLVFVGWTATGAASDFVPTPLGARTPGVCAHAVAADMVLSGRSYRFLAKGWSPALTLLLGALATAATLLAPLASAAAGLALLLAYGWLAVAPAFAASHLVVPMVAPLLGGAAAWIGGTALRAALALRSQQRITRQFKARVAPELVDYLVEHQNSLSMAGEPREVTAFFLDLAGFTTLSEQLGARGSVALLNRCMRGATVELTGHQAYVNKYLGDGLMAFWSAFRAEPDQATHACRAALAVVQQVEQVQVEKSQDGQQLSARVGIATGKVIVGDCGAPPLLHDYTAIGDAINLAARLESANKQFGTKILVDGRTREQVHAGDLRFRPCGRVVVVGQTTAVDLFEVAPPGMSDQEIELTAEAIDAWRSGRIDESGALFLRLQAEYGASKLASLYLSAIAEVAHAGDGQERVLWLKAK